MKELIIRLTIMIISIIILVSCRASNLRNEDSVEPITITIAGYPTDRLAYQDLARKFQEIYPHIHIEYVSLDEQAAHLTPKEFASLADVLLLDEQLTVGGATPFLDLEPLTAAESGFDAEDFWPGIMTSCQTDGIQVGLPLQASTSLIVFDKNAFDATDLPYPEAGWDWNAFQEAVQVLTLQEAEETIRYGFSDRGRPLLLLSPFVDAMMSQIGYEPSQLAAELSWYITLVNQKAIPSPVDDMAENARMQSDLIQTRQVAMWISSQSELSQWQALLGDDFGVVPFPTSEPAGASNPVRPVCVAISSGTTQMEAAWRWVYFLSRNLTVDLDGEHAAPAQISITHSSNYWENFNENTTAAIQFALEHGWYSREFMPELTVVGEALAKTLAGQGTLAENLPESVDTQSVVNAPPDSQPVIVNTPNNLDSTTVAGTLTVDYYAPSFINGNPEAVRILAQAFNENQGQFKVNIISGAFGSSEATENSDCFAWSGNASLFATDNLYSLSPLFEAEVASFQDDFETSQLGNNQVDGQLYALPVAVRPYVVQYNADLFTELELDTPSPDWTVDDFWTLAVAATRNDDDQIIYGFAPNQLFPENLLLFVPNAAPFYDLETQLPRATYTDPTVIQSLIWLSSMVEAGVMYPIQPLGTQAFSSFDNLARQEESTAIEQGRVAMWVEQAGNRDYLFDVGEVPYPMTEVEMLSGQAQSTINLFISRRTSDPSGCWEWLKFLSEQPDAFPGIPVRRTILESPEWIASVGQEATAAYQEMLARPSLILSRTPRVLEQFRITFPYNFWWSDALRHAFAGDTPASALEEVQLRADAYFDCIMSLDEEVSDLEQSMACARESDPEFER
ncbi:MAG: hypothetical protein DHS20C20_02200 [Ardenticatenaceae bacterium]|nr:MAG: hypothetical protein DHS20C20_02200 [Ardenticatenaceae bacterium]